MIKYENKTVYRVCWLIEGQMEVRDHEEIGDAIAEFMELVETPGKDISGPEVQSIADEREESLTLETVTTVLINEK